MKPAIVTFKRRFELTESYPNEALYNIYNGIVAEYEKEFRGPSSAYEGKNILAPLLKFAESEIREPLEQMTNYKTYLPYPIVFLNVFEIILIDPENSSKNLIILEQTSEPYTIVDYSDGLYWITKGDQSKNVLNNNSIKNVFQIELDSEFFFGEYKVIA